MALGGAVAAVEQGYMKRQLVGSNTRRLEAIERGEQTVVGVNRFQETEDSHLRARPRRCSRFRPRPNASRSSGCSHGAVRETNGR
jgi:methylmalonyl-CoA mutase N-terminal domain/subunit